MYHAKLALTCDVNGEDGGAVICEHRRERSTDHLRANRIHPLTDGKNTE